jgi:MFS family permease
VLSVVAGVGAGMLNPAQQAALADIVGRERNGGPALATFQMSADSGTIVGPILAGLLIDHGSYPLAFGITGLVTLLAVIPWLFARETHDVQHGAPTPEDPSGAEAADLADVEATVAERTREA